MSKMNDLATVLDELASTAIHLKMCAQDLLTATTLLRDSLDNPGESEPEAIPEKPSPALEPEATAPKARKPRVQKEQPEPAPQPEPTPEPAAEVPQFSKQQIRAMLADLATNGHRDEAKALVAKYANGGSFSDIDPAHYPELADEVKQYG